MKKSRTHTWEDPEKSAAEGMKLSGMDYLNKMSEGVLPLPPVLDTLDIKPVTILPGIAVFSFEPQEFHYNTIGSVHGGVISTILDSAMGCSVHSLLPQGKGYTTLELKVNFLKAITRDTGTLEATGKIIHAGSRTALVEAQLKDAAGKVYAHGVSTCLIL